MPEQLFQKDQVMSVRQNDCRSTKWCDTPKQYGHISKYLHWLMALLFAWQFAGMVAKVSLGRDAELTKLLASQHADIGLVLLVLVVVRWWWAWVQRARRPAQNLASKLGHFALYGLMFLVPALALLRVFGNTRSFSWFGVIELHAGNSEKVDWMVAPAHAAHGVLGWVLLALIAGHVGMVIIHRWWLKDNVAQRMIGCSKAQD